MSLICLLFSWSFANGQDWKAAYDLAVNQYQSQNYTEALASAQKAYAASKSLDAKNQAYTLQLITVICLDNNQADEGLKWIADETALFLKLEGATSKTYAEALRKHALFLQQKGKPREAELKCAEALAAAKESHGETTTPYATLLAYYGQLLVVNGNLEKAKEALQQSLTQLAKDPDAGEDYLSALSLSANLDKRLNDAASAESKFKRLVSILEQNKLTQLPEYAAAKTALAEMALARGQSAESEKLLQGVEMQGDQKAQQLLKLAIEFQNTHQTNKALENYEAAQKAATDANLSNNTTFSIHLNHGRLLLELNRVDEAAKELTTASQLAAKLYPVNGPEHAIVSFSMGDLRLTQDLTKEAIDLYQKAALSSANLEPSRKTHLLVNAARKLLNANQPEAAVRLLQPDMMAPAQALPQNERVEITLVYCEALIQSNQNDQAITQLSKAIVAAPSVDIKNKYEMELAEALEHKGEWKKALQLLLAVDLTPTLAGEVRAENSFQMARLNQLLGNYAESEKNFRASIAAYRELEVKQPEALLHVYNSLAILYMQLGNYDEAERMYTDLLKQTDTFSGFYTTLQQNLAGLYEETLRYEEAKKLLEQVVQQDRTRLGEQHPDYAVSLQNLGAVYQKMGQLDKAKELYQKAMAVDKAKGDHETLSYATTAANLGVVYQQSGDIAAAQTFFEEALKIREPRLGKDHLDYVFNEYNLAVLLQQQGQPDRAYPLFKHVATTYMQQIKELFPALSEKEKTAFYNKISEVILAYQDFAIENANRKEELLGELYNFRLATKALLLNSSTKVRNRILSSGDAQLLQQFAEWLKTKEELGKIYALPSEDRELNKNQMVMLQQKANELEKNLSARSELFARDNPSEAADWQKVKARLHPGEAAIEMIRLRLNFRKDSVIYAALIVRPESAKPMMVIFPNGKRMEGREFSFYRNATRFQAANNRSYDVYWKPMEKVLAGATTLYFSADGVYNKLNIMALFNPQTNRYMVEDLTIKLVSNTREVLGNTKLGSPIQTASLFGYPDYRLGSTASPAQLNAQNTRGTHTATRAIISNGIPELPGTKDEVTKVAETLQANKWATSLYVGDKATETAVKALQNVGVLHIATHGFFIPTDDNEKKVVHGQDLSQAENNPLLRSGLILTGAERYLLESALEPQKKNPEDGILTAYEAIQLNLDRTDLVILSACETGAGEIKNGEGVYGLQRSFLLAGTNSLLMSLWKVDDEATQELMVEFFRQWSTTKDKHVAFRNTQLAMMKKFNEPYFWGSFVMVGLN